MSRIETALLYIDHPAVAFSHLEIELNKKLGGFGVALTTIHSQDPSKLVLLGPGLRVLISTKYDALLADSYKDALDSPLSAPFREPLVDALLHHQMHVMVSVLPASASTELTSEQYLLATRVAHAASTLICDWHSPVAVHWRQSNQLLTGEKYHSLADDPTPWALLVHPQIEPVKTENGIDANDIHMDCARHFIGRPIVFRNTTATVNQAFAASLAFLRFAIENETEIEDGHTFEQSKGEQISVRHAPSSSQHPNGCYELIAIEKPAVVETVTAPNLGENRETAAQVRATNHRLNRKRSLAISYFMLLIMPPIGVLLLVSNLLFKPNASRTAFVALTSVAAAILLAIAFVTSDGESMATLDQPADIAVDTLSE